jgi:hypothetical protein
VGFGAGLEIVRIDDQRGRSVVALALALALVATTHTS